MTADTTRGTAILSEKLAGVSPKIAKASRAIRLQKAAPLPMPGSHAALLRRLFGEKGHHANAG